MIIGHVAITWQALWLIPLVFELILISLTAAFFLSALFVRYRDVSYIWEVVTQAAFYATPILYPLNRIPVLAAKIIILNPMAQLIQDARYVLVTHDTITISTLYGGSTLVRFMPIGLTIISAIIASTYFRRRSKYFAEES